MTGKYDFVIQTRRVKYEFSIQRNITVIKGMSGTGKTTLIRLLEASLQENGRELAVNVTTNAQYSVYNGRVGNATWQQTLDMMQGRVIFMDEMYSFMNTKEFAEYVKQADCYFVLITRLPLKELSYSVEEVYEIKCSGKYESAQPAYHTLEHFYAPEKNIQTFSPQEILTEDEKAGSQFMRHLGEQIPCLAAQGKSNIAKKLLENQTDGVFVFVDGAAFGAEMEQTTAVLRTHYTNYALWCPESFEWVLLKAGLIESEGLRDCLERTYLYADSTQYISWERYFTKLLVEQTANTAWRYDKGELNPYYYSARSLAKVYKEFPILSQFFAK